MLLVHLFPSENRVLGCQYVVNTSYRSVVRCSLHLLWIVLGFFGNLSEHFDECVDRLLAFALGRLYHHGLMEEKREVDGGSVVAVVEQALCHIHSSYSSRLVLESVEHELMFAYGRNWQGVDIL